ncbi:M20/M25/M40 family metallo-hydrolase [Lysobacter capsici]|uniref:M20/M25/M40 family metallo-hydrolase n=1 Tax=Lysobacter capsici TaxID=435897 RepID=UPI00287B78A0|nr:M20/M25/M40 family metallo-hydrolase [Lysobacter capsici]WND79746.1 M20/M25/M40 family metallo-hydrolase [Lysobacter capsici]WND84942.1 M20/M25/M40 family metallo-hydrolase [Lysobacter capsici]
MDFPALCQHIDRAWQDDILPALRDYIAIPCQSPAFDPDWADNGHMERAVKLMTQWARQQLAELAGATVEVLRLPGRTPLLFIDVPGEAGPPSLIYGHLDKQPPMPGWAPGRAAWTPVLEGERLYGRGGADDGYAIFAAIAALRALRDQGLAHPRCLIVIEASEESGSVDLPAYIELLAPRLGEPRLIVALDAGCGNYDQLWTTTSLRGQVAGTLSVRVLDEGVHSGDASGIVPSSFRIARHLLSRLEDPISGEVIADFQVEIPAARREQAWLAANALGDELVRGFPFHADTRPVEDALGELALNRAWRAQLAITGIDGLPAVADAAAVMQPHTALKLSLRLPPTLDPQAASQRLKTLLEVDPPYRSEVRFTIDSISQGWHAPAVAPWLADSLQRASRDAFGRDGALIGGGGGIPFLAMLGERFPRAQFVVTGVLGPQSNAHGPNEFLHLPTARRVTAALARLLHDARGDAGPR